MGESKKETKPYGDDKGIECEIADPCSYAACVFLLLGFLGAGIMLIITGTELQKSVPDFETAEVVYAIGAGFFILAMIGHYMGVPDVICGTKKKGLPYFGHMFIFLGYVGVAGFMIGSAINMNAGPDASSVEAFSYLAGAFLIVFVLGWLIGNHERMACCENDTFLVSSVGHYLVVIFMLVAAGLYFGFGVLFKDGNIEDSGTVLLVIGVCFIITSIGMVLLKCC